MVPTPADRDLERLRAMTPAEKLRVADGMRADALRLARAVLAQEHPDWDDATLDRETRWRVLGPVTPGSSS